MKTYVSNPVHVQAAQWDGSKEHMLALKKDFGILHDNIAYTKDGAVARWSIGERKGYLNVVNQGNYFVKDANGVVVLMPAKQFEAGFSLMP